jgi:hypothetical protein
VNKQEALEALLAECRKYETPDGMRSEPARRKLREKVVTNFALAMEAEEAEEPEDVELRARHLAVAGGALLAMLVDEEG